VNKFAGSIAIRQRVLPPYRKPFFDLLNEHCLDGCTVLAGQPAHGETMKVVSELEHAKLITVENHYRGSGTFLNYRQKGVAEHLVALQPTVFVSEANPRLIDMRRVVGVMKSKNVPCIGWGIGTTDFWNRPLKHLRLIFRKRFLRLFDGMVCYSSVAAEQYASLGFPEDKLFPIYNAVLPHPKGNYPVRAPLINRPAKIISVGRLVQSKGLDRLIHAVQQAASSGFSLELKLIGDGSDRERLEKIASSAGVSVEFMGHKSGDELAEIATAADLFVLPGLGGLAIQEAMSFGLPVVVTEADGTEVDLVRENGWITKKEDVAALASTIMEALSHPEDLQRRGRESFRIAQDEINRELMAERFIDAVYQISEKHSSSLGLAPHART
jgi:glycosyltransferase involved in cell wall biosynthesis